MPWLLKTEPSTYSFENLVKDKQTRWDGISNPAALKNLKSAKKGDVVVIYHTGNQKAAVGLAEIIKEAYGEPPVVDIKAGKPLKKPTTLAEFKSDKLFKDSPLVKQGRLSFVPLTDEQLARICR